MTAFAARLYREARDRERGLFAQPTLTAIMTDARLEVTGVDSVTGVVVMENVAAVDQNEYNFLHPLIDYQMTSPGSSLTGRSIMEELMEDRLSGRVAPFKQGPIGAYKRRPVPKTYTLSNWPELERKAMLELRAKNDANLTRLEGSL
jgi:hypothetical protein